MKKQIIALIVALAIIFTCCGFAVSNYNEEAEAVIDYVEEIVEEEKDPFKIERIEEFIDKNLSTYSMDELQSLIEEQRKIHGVKVTEFQAR